MNSKITEIAVKAGMYIPENKSAMADFDYKVFAELLVRECIGVINQPNGVGDEDVIKITRDVENHFGIEDN